MELAEVAALEGFDDRLSLLGDALEILRHFEIDALREREDILVCDISVV
jgi:hypothetical protein